MPGPSLTSADLQAYIDTHQLEAEILHLAEETSTVPEAARVVGCAPEQIVKSVLFVVNGEPFLCIASGSEPISQRNLAARLGVGKKRVKLAKADEVLRHTGYAVGSVPPIGHATSLATFIDPRVLEQGEVYGGGGDSATLMRISAADLQAHLQAEILPM